MKVMSIVMVLGFVGFFFAGSLTSVRTVIAEKQVKVDTLSDKIADLKNDLLNSLQASCESIGWKQGDALIVFDSNKVASVGPYQWQLKSIIHYSKVLRNEIITPSEALILANNYDESRKLAGEVIFNSKAGVKTDWKNCDIKLGLSGQLAFIQKLQK